MSGAPIELLSDGEADTLAVWLKAQPGTEVVARDRASAYTDAAHRGAPQAVQVADRWHLPNNLQEAAQRFLVRQSQLLKRAGEEARKAQAEAMPFSRGSLLASATLARRQENRAKRERLHQDMLSLRQQGKSQRRIARELGVSRGRMRSGGHLADGQLRARLRRLWWGVYRHGAVLGLEHRRYPARPLRLHRGNDRPFGVLVMYWPRTP